MKRDKPPYTIEKPSGWYWQPKGSIENFSSPQPLGSHMREAFKEGWRLYHEAKAALEEPSSRPKTYTVNWGIALWRVSDDYRYRADGKPKAKNTLIAYESGLTAIEAKISMLDLRSLLEAGGAHPGAIQSLLAHKTVGTQEYYVKRERADLAQEARERYRKERKGKGRP